jgi:hypothetical protein
MKEPTYWDSAPDVAKEYPHLEKYFSDMAQELGMTPAQFQASVWLGAGGEAGLQSDEFKSFVETFADQVNRRSQINTKQFGKGWTPRETLKKFIRGETALTIGGGLVLFNQLPPDVKSAIMQQGGGGDDSQDQPMPGNGA